MFTSYKFKCIFYASIKLFIINHRKKNLYNYSNGTISLYSPVFQAIIDQCASDTQDAVAGEPAEQPAEM